MKSSASDYVEPDYVEDDYIEGQLVDYLRSNNQYIMADLFTVALATGEYFYWTSFDVDVADQFTGHVFSSGGPILRRGNTRTVIGLEVDTMDMSLCPRSTDVLNGVPMIKAAMQGAFDQARIVVDRAFLADDLRVIGTINLFTGHAADITLGGTEIQIRVNSDLAALAVQMPRNLYQAGCMWSVYRNGCDLNRSLWGVAKAVQTGSTKSIIKCSLSQSVGWFNRGAIRFISGDMVNVTRTVKSYVPGQIRLYQPLPSMPVAGSLFIAYPGCDRTQAMCKNKFNNLPKFRGCPFIPVAETAV